MHEIITLQAGPRANYLATHFWNAQQCYQSFAPDADDPPSPVNHDVHFRQGRAADGSETYLPRTLIYDLRNGFGSLARVNALGAMEEEGEAEKSLRGAQVWNGPLTRLPALPQATLSPYAKALLASLEPVAPSSSTTAYFADFASTYFHPRSLLPLSPPFPTTATAETLSPSSLAPHPPPQFSTFQHGVDLFLSRDSDLDVFDSDLRPWIEEADAPQALQLFASTDDAWAGFAARYLETIHDELPKLCTWVWAADASVSSPGSRAAAGESRIRMRERAANTALALRDFTELATMTVPMGVPGVLPSYVDLKRDASLWATSGLLCAGVESAGLAVRMNSGSSSSSSKARPPVFGDWADLLGMGGKRGLAGLKYGLTRGGALRGQDADVRMAGRGAGGGRASEGEDGEGGGGEEERELDADLDVDLFPADIVPSGRGGGKGRVLGRKNKTFARVDAFRRDDGDKGGGGGGGGGGGDVDMASAGDDRMQRFGGPVIERYSAHPAHPLPLTFPPLFSNPSNPSTSSNHSTIPIHTSLSTSSRIATWVRSVAGSVSTASSIVLPGELAVPGEEREALRNALLEVAEGYVEGWEEGGSGSEGSED